MQFYQLAKGARFEFYGRKFEKIAMSMADSLDGGDCAILHGSSPVTPIGEPLLLSEEEAEEWSPEDLAHWADHIKPAPGQVL